jgi:hypothetical protein
MIGQYLPNNNEKCYSAVLKKNSSKPALIFRAALQQRQESICCYGLCCVLQLAFGWSSEKKKF